MAINFPNNPAVNDTFTVGSVVYKWDGTSWNGEVLSTGGGASALANLIDVDLTTEPVNGDVLVYDGTNWIARDIEKLFISSTSINSISSSSANLNTGILLKAGKKYWIDLHAIGTLTSETSITVTNNAGNFIGLGQGNTSYSGMRANAGSISNVVLTYFVGPSGTVGASITANGLLTVTAPQDTILSLTFTVSSSGSKSYTIPAGSFMLKVKEVL